MTPFARPARQPLSRLNYAFALALLALFAGCSSNDLPAPGTDQPTAYAAVARGRIDIEGGLLNLTMPREGILASVDVHEGDHVSKGQLLATLEPESAQFALAGAQAALEQVQAQTRLLDVKQAAAKQRAQRLSAALAAGAGDGQSADDAREASAQLSAERQVHRAAIDIASEKLDEARYEVKQRRLFAPFDAEVIHVSAQPGA
ncbi:MAG: secretion protein HlyD, partial [Rhodanobacter sp.]